MAGSAPLRCLQRPQPARLEGKTFCNRVVLARFSAPRYKGRPIAELAMLAPRNIGLSLMASQLATSPAASTTAPQTPTEQFAGLCVRRRVPITVGLLAALLLLDGYVFHGRPRDVLNWSDPLAAAGVLVI